MVKIDNTLKIKQYNTMKRRIRLTEGMLHRMIKEAINEMWDIDDNGIIDFDEFGKAKNSSYADKHDIPDNYPSDAYQNLQHTPYFDEKAITDYSTRDYEHNPFALDSKTDKYMRPSDYYVKGWESENDSLDESIHRAIRRVLSEGRNDELFQWFGYLVANDAQGLRSLGDIDSAKEAIAEKINQSSLTPTQKRNYLNGKYDFKGIMGAKDLNMLSKIIAQIWLASNGLSVQDTGRRKRF